MRARNIKPSIFKNELLGTADPLLTILFEGLWCEADRDGRLEDRPLRIKAEVFPYRNSVDIEALLKWLDDNHFILRYESLGTKVIQVIKFKEHQRPHSNEIASVLPTLDKSTVNQGRKRCKPTAHQGQQHGELTSAALRSDSPSLIPDSPSLIPDPGYQDGAPRLQASTTKVSSNGSDPPAWFTELRASYPKRSGDQGWREAQRAANARLKDGHLPSDILAGVHRYAAYCASNGNVGTKFVKRAATFLGPELYFLEPWSVSTKSAITLESNITAGQTWLASQEKLDERR